MQTANERIVQPKQTNILKQDSEINAVINVLKNNYASGFRFDTTYINLLSKTSGVDVDSLMQAALKRIMFQRDDGIYFLLDITDVLKYWNSTRCIF